MAHPLRLQMLSLLTGSSLSATELSRELGISHARASYHLRQLHEAGVVELAEVRPRQGGRERRFSYRAGSPGSRGTVQVRQAHGLFAEALCVEVRRRVRQAQEGATRLGIDAELWVEPADWQTAFEAIKAAGEELHRRALPPRSAGAVRVSVSALLFAMTDAPSESSGGEGRG